MPTCRAVTKDVLTDPIPIQVDGDDLNFSKAKRIADQKAQEVASHPMLLGWYEKLPAAWLQEGVGVLLTTPLYIVLFCIGALCLLLSVFFRD